MKPAARRFALLLAGVALSLAVGSAQAARESRIASTKHNLSASGPGPLKANTESQICVFCHTPHGSTSGVAPLWNRQLSTTTSYTTYSSNSLDATQISGAVLEQPGGSSKLCLSCHDGAMAIGSVNVLGGTGSFTTPGSVPIAMAGTGTGGVMTDGDYGKTTGFTRNLGTDLSNDHPISLTYNSTLVTRDGELRALNASTQQNTGTLTNPTGTLIGVRAIGYKPKVPLEATAGSGTETGQIQCASCHDPHIRETDATQGNQKFLRLNRFQTSSSGITSTVADFNAANDIICLACHDKNGSSGAWAFSAHANDQVANQTYTNTAATLREFPANLPVWRAACLNCHDTHTVSGARRLLREGTNSGAALPKAGGAGTSALEETCYQCHDGSTTVLNSVATVPNIKSDFALSIKMPITSTNQPGSGVEKHDIGGNFNDTGFVDCTGATNKCGKDFIESRTLLGVGVLANRHAECTDCHNPHRVVKFRDFRGAGGSGSISGAPDTATATVPQTATHEHRVGSSTPAHSNIASGVLRGSWGVEPTYNAANYSFHLLPTGYVVKRGDPGANTDSSSTAAYVTREYQVCLKCHSDYGYTDNNVYPAGNRPSLTNSLGGTPSGTNGLTVFTNVAKEFRAPTAHQGEGTKATPGAGAGYLTNNHRSWHPVMDVTGRTAAIRGSAATNWNHPFQNPGAQTMYCTDCHGSQVSSNSSVVPDRAAGAPWGPHGSNNNFLLKGLWNNTIVQTDSTVLCYKCHKEGTYNGTDGTNTGFMTDKGDGHKVHRDKVNGKNAAGNDTNNTFKCSYCHVAVPHGWKNKALLVNLNDVGEEAGQPAGSSKEVAISDTDTDTFNQAPYYMKAKLKIIGFKTSGAWTGSDCGSRGLATGNANLIAGSGGSTNSTRTGVDWMQNTCKNPP